MRNGRGRTGLVGSAALSALVIGGVLAGASPSSAAPAGPAPAQPASVSTDPLLGGTDQLIVTPTSGDAVETAELAADAGTDVRVVRKRDGGSYVVKLPKRLSGSAVDALAQKWTRHSNVALAEPDRINRVFQTPNDPQYANQWHYKAPVAGSYGANLPGAWDVTTGSSSVVVAVLDTGITNHADLAGQYLQGYDFINDAQVANDGNLRDSDPSDPGDWITATENASGYFKGCGTSNSSWHGTHVSGTIAAKTNNSLGVAGIAWNAKILPLRVLGKCGGYDSDIIDAAKWAAGLSVSGVPTNTTPAQVISLSLGGTQACSSAWQTAVNQVVAAGTTMVVAAGNENADASTASPGNCSGVITVGATGPTGSRAYYSNYGSSVEISAPGGDSQLGNTVLSTLNTGTQGPVADTYAYYQGTSMATPHVSGVVALIKSIRPNATPAQVLSYLQGNVTPFPSGSTCTTSICGAGILNANNAVRAAAIPAAPGTPSATGGNASASVTWTAPVSTGGPAVTGYTVTPYIGATAQTAQVFNSTATTQTVTGLTNGTAYTFKVAATNIAGTGTQSGASNAVTPATVPGAPGTPTATAGNATASVTWTAPASSGGAAVTGYTVTPYVGATAQTASVFNSTATTQTITGLTNGTTYTFKVAATNAVGTGTQSAASNAVTPVNPATAPGAPGTPTATAGNTTASVTWTAPASDGGSAITGYTVTPYVGATAQTPRVFTSTATTQSITGLTNGTAYTFKVAATNAIGTGSQSAASNAVTPSTVPGAPGTPSATGGNTTASVTWTAPASDGGSAITGYTVTPYIGATAQTPRVFASTSTTQTVTGLTNGVTYTFTVSATNGTGTGTASAASNAVTPATTPGVPGTPGASGGNGQATVTWTAPASDGGSAITGYTVTPYLGATAQTASVFDATTTTRTITGLTNGVTYTFTVAATNGVGTGNASAASNAVTPATTPDTPGAPTATGGNGQVTLFWAAPASDGGSAITGYTITPYVGATAQTPIAADADTTETVTGLTNGVTYTFTVTATNGVGSGSASAASNAVTPATVPGTPGSPSGVPGDGQAVVSWSAPSSDGGAAITGYVVTPYVGGVAQAPQTFASTATTQTVTGLANGSLTTFTVAATNSAGTGAESAPSATVWPHAGLPQLRIGDVRVDESAGVAVVPVTLSKPATVNVTFNAKTGTATAGSDYTAVSGLVLAFSASGPMTKTVNVPIANDADKEGTETITTALTASSTVLSLADTGGTITIVDDDALPAQIWVGDVPAVTEGGTAVFTVAVQGRVDTAATVPYTTATGTAGAADFTATSGSLAFAVGEVDPVRSISVPVADDPDAEGIETFSLKLTSVAGLTFVDTAGTATIAPSDGGTGTMPAAPRIRIDDARVDEADGVAHVAVRVDQSVAATVKVATKDAKALAGSDYTAVPSTTLSFTAGGPTVKMVDVPIAADGNAELDETLTLSLSSASKAVIADATGTVTIQDSDGGVPRIRISDAKGREGQNAAFLVCADGRVDTTVTVNLATATGTASASDFGALSASSVTFTAGTVDPCTVITVALTSDGVAEATAGEKFTVKPTLPSGSVAVLSDMAGTGLIVD